MAEERLLLWLSNHSANIDVLGAKLTVLQYSNDQEFTVEVEAGGNTLHVKMPCALVIGINLVNDEFEGTLNDLNVKLQDLSPLPQLETVLDHLLGKLVLFQGYEACDTEEGEEQVAEEEEHPDPVVLNTLQLYATGSLSLCGIADNASVWCQFACRPGGLEGLAVLSWCSVLFEPGQRIKLKMDLSGLLATESIAQAVGLSLQDPLFMVLEFEDVAWKMTRFTLDSFIPRVRVFQELQEKMTKQAGIELNSEYTLSHLIPGLSKMFIHLCKTGELEKNLQSKNRLFYADLNMAKSLDNPILGLLFFVGTQLSRLTSWCPFCYTLLPADTYKLQTCASDFCQYSSEETGLGVSVLAAVSENPAVMELQLSLMKAAARSQMDVFEPFPSFLLKERETRQRNGWFGNNCHTKIENKMLRLVSQVLETVPEVSELMKCERESALEELLSKASAESVALTDDDKAIGNSSRLAYKLVRYCLSTNRMNMRLLEGSEELCIRGTIGQFAVIYDSPEKEARLGSRSTSSFFAFHGSKIGNWYSILRNGIRSMSGTRYQVNGHAYGNGAYCSHRFSKAATFSCFDCARGYGRLRDGFSCVAIVEVFHEKMQIMADYCYVVPTEHVGSIAVRYLLIFDSTRATTEYLIDGCMLENTTNLLEHHRALRANWSSQIDRKTKKLRTEA